jgi:cytochrome b
MTPAPSTRIRVWDLPTRLFHWLLALAIVGSIATVKIGGNLMVWHERLGYFVLTLLLFRLAWGVVGGRYARFANFVRGPRAVLGYLRGVAGTPHAPGHNPLGALSVMGLLAVLAFQAGSGSSPTTTSPSRGRSPAMCRARHRACSPRCTVATSG